MPSKKYMIKCALSEGNERCLNILDKDFRLCGQKSELYYMM